MDAISVCSIPNICEGRENRRAKLLPSAPRLGEMRKLGLANASSYTSTRMASCYVETYCGVLERCKGLSGGREWNGVPN